MFVQNNRKQHHKHLTKRCAEIVPMTAHDDHEKERRRCRADLIQNKRLDEAQ